MQMIEIFSEAYRFLGSNGINGKDSSEWKRMRM